MRYKVLRLNGMLDLAELYYIFCVISRMYTFIKGAPKNFTTQQMNVLLDFLGDPANLGWITLGPSSRKL